MKYSLFYLSRRIGLFNAIRLKWRSFRGIPFNDDSIDAALFFSNDFWGYAKLTKKDIWEALNGRSIEFSNGTQPTDKQNRSYKSISVPLPKDYIKKEPEELFGVTID